MFTECICLSGLALDFGDTDMTVTDEFMPSLNLHASMGRQHRPNKKTCQEPFRGKKQKRGKEGNHGGGLLTWASVEGLSKMGAFECRRAGGEVSHGSSWGGSIQSIGNGKSRSPDAAGCLGHSKSSWSGTGGGRMRTDEGPETSSEATEATTRTWQST